MSIENLIQNLQTDAETKKLLLAEFHTSGVTEELIEKISKIIDEAENKFLEQAEAEMQKFQLDLKEAKDELNKIERSASKAKDAEELEKIRKQIQS